MSKTVAKINNMLAFVRQQKEVGLAEFCMRFGCAPSTAYLYWRMMKTMAEDIIIKDGKIICQ